MKYILSILCILFVLSSCEQHITDAFAYSGILELTSNKMNFSSGAYSKSLEVKGVIDWDIDTTQLTDWCRVDAVKNHKNHEYLTIFVDSNEMISNRETFFSVISGKQKQIIKIEQLGNLPQILFSQDSLTVGKDTNFLKINIVTNIEYEMSYTSDWFSAEDVKFENNQCLIVRVSPNETGIQREGSVIFKHKNGDELWVWKLRQLPVQSEYEVVGIEEFKPNLKVIPISSQASSEVKNKEIQKSYDGSKTSYYQSSYQQESDPIILEYFFDGATPIHYINYVPYVGDSEKSFKSVEIWLKENGGEYYLLQRQNFKSTGEQVFNLQGEEHKPEAIKFVVKSSYDKEVGLLVAACSEMEFYSAEIRYPEVFADKVYGSLHKSVNLDNIFAIDDPLLKNIAYHLYHRSYESGRIFTCKSYPKLSMFMGRYGEIDNVTGIYVKRGELLPVFVNNVGQNVVYLTLFNPQIPMQMKKYRLYDGINKFEMEYDGHLYIDFHTKVQSTIEVHIAGGEYIGKFDVTDIDKSGFVASSDAEYCDVLGEHAQLLFKRKSIEGKDLTALIKKYDDIVRSQQIFMGLLKYNQDIPNRILFLESEDDLEIKYSKKNYVACPSTEISKLSDADAITGKVFWDIALAIGEIHNHEMLTWKGVTCTSPKLFALASQEAMGEDLSIDVNDWYHAGFKSIIVPEKKLKDLADDNYQYPEKIVPFWQLKIYAEEVLGMKDFYKDILFQARTMPIPLDMFFINILQSTLKANLDPFVKPWGFSSTYPCKYEKVPSTMIYLNPDNVEIFKNPGIVKADGYSVSRGKITIVNPQNAVVFYVRHTFIPTMISTSPIFNVMEWKDSMKVYAIGVDGTEIELKRL